MVQKNVQKCQTIRPGHDYTTIGAETSKSKFRAGLRHLDINSNLSMTKGGTKRDFNMTTTMDPQEKIWQTYVQKNQKFRDTIDKLKDSINEPAIREDYIKQVKLQEDKEFRQKKKEGLIDKTSDSSDFVESDT